MSNLDKQVGGDHYKTLAIQPMEYIHKNKIPFIEGCVIKYLTRWRGKGGIQDLEKAKHFLDYLIEVEGKNSKFDDSLVKLRVYHPFPGWNQLEDAVKPTPYIKTTNY